MAGKTSREIIMAPTTSTSNLSIKAAHLAPQAAVGIIKISIIPSISIKDSITTRLTNITQVIERLDRI